MRDLDGFEYNAQPSVDPGQIRELATCRWIAHGDPTLFLGPPGTGKAHLAAALGREAIRQNYSTQFGGGVAQAARHRLQLSRACCEPKHWQVKRCERTRQLIELGGLVAKAGLIDLTNDARAVIFGLLINATVNLRSDDRNEALILWRRRGKQVFRRAASTLGEESDPL